MRAAWEGMGSMRSAAHHDPDTVPELPEPERPQTRCWADGETEPCKGETRSRTGLCPRHEEEILPDGLA